MSQFSLWERDLTINVKNFTLNKPEDTVFKVSDYRGVDYYRWSVFIPDIKKLTENSLSIELNTLNCKYNIKINVNPNAYIRDLTLSHKYNDKLTCKLDIEPKSYESNIIVSTKETPVIKDISLNDLAVWHYIWVFVFWLFMVIAFWIRDMDKKWTLINKNNK
jgi:hypothetical protein